MNFQKKIGKKLKEKSDKEKIIFLSNLKTFKDLRLILKLKVPAIKIGSDDFTNIPLIKMAKKKQASFNSVFRVCQL